MKTFFTLLLCGLVVLVSDVSADKICVKGSNPRGKKVKLSRSVVASSASCPKGSIEIFDTAVILGNGVISTDGIADGAVTAAKIGEAAVGVTKISSTGSTTGSFLTSNGTGGATFSPFTITSSLLPSNAALLDRSSQTFTGMNSFPVIQLLTDNGNSQAAPIGELNRDNIGVAWARITAAGGIDTNYNVLSVDHTTTGKYNITLQTSLQSGFSLVPVVTPEVDPDGMNNPPTGAANMRIAVTNQVAAGTNFDVYMYNGSGTLVDNDFQFVLFGR